MTRRRGLPFAVLAALVLTSLLPALAAGQSPRPSLEVAAGSTPTMMPASTRLVHHRFGRLWLDAPVDWVVRPGRDQRYGRIVGFIGQLPSLRIGRAVRIRPSDLASFIERAAGEG